MASKKDVLAAIKAHRLFKDYHAPSKEINRDEIEQSVNATGEATDRLMDLQRRLKVAIARESDYPPALVKDAKELHQLIQTALVTLYADSEDGQIAPKDFMSLFEPLAGMVEGLLATANMSDPEVAMDLRSMKYECQDKAFYRQLRKLLESGDQMPVPTASFSLGKALSSLLTHVFIKAEGEGRITEALVDQVADMLKTLARPRAQDVLECAKKVVEWRLVDAAMPKLPQLTASMKARANDPEGKEPKGNQKRWDGEGTSPDKDEIVPPLLAKAPGDPKDVKDDGQELEQDKGGLEKGLPKKIDGQKLEPDEETGQKESVEVQYLREDRVQRNFAIRVGGKILGGAVVNKLTGKVEAVVGAGKRLKVESIEQIPAAVAAVASLR